MNTVEKIEAFLRFGSVLGLERMNVLLEKLGNPQDDLKVIHVAGTNGKGSICRYLYEALQTGGFKTGLYTSPFIEVFNERIQFDGENISDADLATYTDMAIEKANEMVAEGLESPTEFELITAVAFLYYKEKNADFVILEVGLGGSGDSTNVVKEPLATVIASISLDHTDRLGETIAEIAAEKAGIIKAFCPVITSAKNEEALKVIAEKAASLGADVYKSNDFDHHITKETLLGYGFDASVFGEEVSIDLSMIGKHQVENAMAALVTLMLLRKEGKIDLSLDAIKAGFKKAKHIGRFEMMSENPCVIIDGAHNPDGSKALKDAVLKYFAGKKVQMVIGILADKDIGEVLENFLEVTDNFVVTKPNNPRAMAAADLAEIIEGKGGKCTVFEEAGEAVEFAKERYGDFDLTLYAGSLYLIGEIRKDVVKC